MIVGEHLFTLASDWCPHPEWWTAHDRQSAEVEVAGLVEALVRVLQPELVVETGTAHGHTAKAIGHALRLNGHGWLHTLEVDGVLVEEARRRCDGLPVIVHHQSSLEWEPPGELGFAWFDSLLDLRIPEFDRYRPWLPVGSVVGFHDVAPHHGRWTLDLIEHPHLRPLFLRTPRGVCLAQVV